MSKIAFAQVVRRKRRRISVLVFHSRGCKHALSCQALPLLRGYAHVVRGFLLFLGPNLGPRKRYAGNFLSHIRVIFWQPHVGQEFASLHGRQQNQQPHISH